jgi:hypothetical protein
MFRTVLSLVQDKLGDSGLERALAWMPEDLSEAIRYGRIVPSGWYSVRWFRELLGAAARASGQPLFVKEMGRAGLRVEYGSVYRALMRLLAPESLLETGMTHFSQVYTVGKVDPIEFREGYARVYWYKCTDFDCNVWQYLIGACVGMIELSGGKSVQTRILRGGEHEDLEAIARWQ